MAGILEFKTGGRGKSTDLGYCLLDTIGLWADMEVWGSLVEFLSRVSDLSPG